MARKGEERPIGVKERMCSGGGGAWWREFWAWWCVEMAVEKARACHGAVCWGGHNNWQRKALDCRGSGLMPKRE